MIPLCGISNPLEKRPFLAFFGVKHSTSPQNALWHERLEVLFTLTAMIPLCGISYPCGECPYFGYSPVWDL